MISKCENLRLALNATIQNYLVACILSCVILYFIPSIIRNLLLSGLAVLVISHFLAPVLDNWRLRKKINTRGKAVLITGCDSGFGHALANDLQKEGFKVFAGCLLPDGEGARNLKSTSSSLFSIVPLDVTSDESIREAHRYVKDNLGSNKLWAVVNNAGIAQGGEVLWTDFSSYRNILEVNTLGVVKITKTFLPLLCQSKGRVVTVSSLASRFAMPFMSAYSMSKSAVTSFCESLRQEMHRFNVKVITIEPASFKTPIIKAIYDDEPWEKAPEDIKKLYPDDYAEKMGNSCRKCFKDTGVSNNPQEVVDCMKEAVTAENPKFLYSPGLLKALIKLWFVAILPKPVVDTIIYAKLNDS